LFNNLETSKESCHKKIIQATEVWHQQETKERVAKAGGESRAQDKEGLSETGRKGGESVSQDRENMSEIGKKGGQNSNSGGSNQ
jgi:general stress protein YciG